ncbi:MAG TPA: ABC transporter permease [Nitriliruptoraceae bacterium]|nr:ABC transporter permease [Nitriliruptoraceae bacterium]
MALQLLVRTATLVVTLVLASLMVFGFMTVLPGSAARVQLGVNATEESVAQLEAEFGLDRPLPEQYWDWVSGLPEGDFGTSYVTKATIGPQIVDRMLVTLWLVGAGMVVALVIAVPVGTMAAVRHRTSSGTVLTALSQVGIAIPSFLAGILLVSVFSVWLGWFPPGGWTPPSRGLGEFLGGLALPALALGLVQGSVLSRYVRSTVLNTQREDFMRTARSKGLLPRQAMVRHGLRNAAIPVVTVLGIQMSTLLVGAVVVEKVFVIPGLGSLLLDGVANRDLLLVQGVVMVLVVAILAVNWVVDVLYTILDPRLRAAT